MTDRPRLWTWQLSPFAGKVRVALAEKGAEVDLLEIHPTRRPPGLKAVNPLMRVPVLEVGGVAIRESAAICEWLEETHPDPPLWPADLALRGWARGWARFLDDGPTADVFGGLRKQAFGLAEGDPPDIVATMHGRVPKAWMRIEALLAEHDGPWLCGEQFTLADVGGAALAVRVPQWLPALAPDPAELPLTAAWLEALRARPSSAGIEQAGPDEPLAA